MSQIFTSIKVFITAYVVGIFFQAAPYANQLLL